MDVIGVASQLCMGKDVLCDHLAWRLNAGSPKWERGAFANAVKTVFEGGFGVDREFLEKWKRNPEAPPGFKKNIRQSLQFIGDGFRQIKDEIWIEIALRDEKQRLIISDSRYINEARAIKQKGGIMILMFRPGFMNNDPNPSESQLRPLLDFAAKNLQDGPIPSLGDMLDRFSEVPDEITYYDFFIINDKGLDDLYEKADKILVPYIQKKFPSKEVSNFLF